MRLRCWQGAVAMATARLLRPALLVPPHLLRGTEHAEYMRLQLSLVLFFIRQVSGV
jgi:hypothetical protein